MFKWEKQSKKLHNTVINGEQHREEKGEISLSYKTEIAVEQSGLSTSHKR